MEPRVAPELLELIIDEAANVPPTLPPLSLVSRHCAFRARKYIFKRVHLGSEGESWSFPYDSGSERQLKRLEAFRGLLEANESLAPCVQWLDINMSCFTGPENVEAKRNSIESLVYVIQRLSSLSWIRIVHSSFSGGDGWDSIPKRVQDAIADCFLRPSIRRISVVCFANFPYRLVFSSPGLQVLDLVTVRPCADTEGHDVAASTPYTGATGLIQLDSRHSLILPTVLASPDTFSSLQTLRLALSSRDDWKAYCRILQVCCATLLRISIVIQVKLERVDAATEENVPDLPNVKHLELMVLFSIEWRPTHVDVSTHGISYAESALSLHSKLLSVLESLTLKVLLSTSTFNFLNSYPILEGSAAAWTAFDEWLASRTSGQTRVEVHFEILLLTGGDADPQDKIKVANQLVREATALFTKTAETGHLSISAVVLTKTDYRAQYIP
ncbi:hypothetical protein DFP72DRAFT_877541 [Ephemerocybe angulata]|uniref:Uncharacterized protein n=1 Tax=Ephemerocybe angulata TaxID=980116 RepID=A0A8H6MDJ7_9AGAR|nr:hypothetical protein DFP72DRAFT_877541 [Tulosesus angulatus]